MARDLIGADSGKAGARTPGLMATGLRFRMRPHIRRIRGGTKPNRRHLRIPRVLGESGGGLHIVSLV